MLAHAGESTADLTPCTCSPGPGRRDTEGDWSHTDTAEVVTHTKTPPSALGGVGRSRGELPAEPWALFNMDVLPGRHAAPCWDFKLSGARGGVTGVAALQLERSLAWVPAPAFPCGSCSATGDASQEDALHNHELQGHLPTH